MDKISCNICNSNEYNKLYAIKNSETEVTFDLVMCSQCHLVYINPQPTAEELGRYYVKGEYYSYGEVLKEDQSKLDLFSKIKKFLRKQIFLTYGGHGNSCLRKIKMVLYFPLKRRFGGIPPFKKNAKLLDIGCGDGLFIKQLKDLGWSVSGIEIDREAVKRAQSHNLDVRCGKFEELEVKDETYDVVRLWHVLEHFKHPKQNLKKIANILKLKGQIIIGIPNVNSLYSKIFKQDWSGFDVPRHLYHFSPQTIKKILVECGYSDIKIYYNSVGTGLASLVSIMNIKFKNETLVNLLFNNVFFRFISISLDFLLDIFRLGGCLEVRGIKK